MRSYRRTPLITRAKFREKPPIIFSCHPLYALDLIPETMDLYQPLHASSPIATNSPQGPSMVPFGLNVSRKFPLPTALSRFLPCALKAAVLGIFASPLRGTPFSSSLLHCRRLFGRLTAPPGLVPDEPSSSSSFFRSTDSPYPVAPGEGTSAVFSTPRWNLPSGSVLQPSLVLCFLLPCPVQFAEQRSSAPALSKRNAFGTRVCLSKNSPRSLLYRESSTDPSTSSTEATGRRPVIPSVEVRRRR